MLLSVSRVSYTHVSEHVQQLVVRPSFEPLMLKFAGTLTQLNEDNLTKMVDEPGRAPPVPGRLRVTSGQSNHLLTTDIVDASISSPKMS